MTTNTQSSEPVQQQVNSSLGGDSTASSSVDSRWDMFSTVPVPPFDGDYCHSQYTESGHLVMLSDTPGNEFTLHQHADGSYEMYLPMGKVQKETEGDYVHLVVANNKVWIKGSSLLHIDGNANINVGKNAYVGVSGELVVKSDGDMNLTSKGNMTLQANKINMNGSDGVTTTGGAMHFPSDVFIHGDLHVQQSAIVSGNFTTNSSLFALCGVMTPGSLIVGPQAWAMPLASLVTNIVLIDCLSFDVITELNYNIVAGAEMSINSLGPSTYSSESYIDITPAAALTIDAGGLIDIAAAGGIDIAAGGVIGIQGSDVSILPDAQIGDILSVIGHIHSIILPLPGHPVTPPLPGT